MSLGMSMALAVAAKEAPIAVQPIVPATAHDWQLSLPDAASPAMAEIADIHRLLLYVGVAVFLIFLWLILWVMIRYNRLSNPVPGRKVHNPFLQAAWFCIPVIVLVLLAVPSLKFLYVREAAPKPDLTVVVVGEVGFWTYEYPGGGDFRFDSRILDAKTAKDYGQPNLLAVDYPLMVPVNRTVEILVTSADVMHAWSVPALGVAVAAVPGRIAGARFKATKLGIYYGMCGETCGTRKGFMPIAVKVVSEEEFEGWLNWARGRYADASGAFAVAER
jgi:cytochrome c oxidase subunit II